MTRRKVIINKGQIYGRLKVIKEADPYISTNRLLRQVLCRCDCGRIATIKLASLRQGLTRSCGCLHREASRERTTIRNTTHGMGKHRLSILFNHMIARCYNEKCSQYKNYGGRGIKICKLWLNDRSKFFDWALSHGWKRGLTIDRINNDGDYKPSNCRFVTTKIQNNNTRQNWYYKYRGEYLTLAEISDITGVDYHVIRWRLKRGWNLINAAEIPVGTFGRWD